MSVDRLYTVGGSVKTGKGVYIERRADEHLVRLCRAGEFAYVLSTRQVGKSSLRDHTAEHLALIGHRPVIVDLTRFGAKQTTEEKWYLGILVDVAAQLASATDVIGWWKQRSHLSSTHRLTLFFQEVLLKEVGERVVVFIDEIDTTLSLPFSVDDFYAAIRYLHGARAQDGELERLSFVLLGVATPSDLMRDPVRTPFNIGQRVELTDFTFQEARPLAEGLSGKPPAPNRPCAGCSTGPPGTPT